jgi:hypothetical protein
MKLQAHRFEHRGKFKDYAILYRSNHQARMLRGVSARPEDSLPVLSGGKSFLRQGRDQGHHRLPAPAGQRGRRSGLHPRRSPRPSAASARDAAGARHLRRRAHISLFHAPSRKASRIACSRASLSHCWSSATSSTAFSAGEPSRSRRSRCCPTCSRPSTTKPYLYDHLKKSARRKRAGAMSANSPTG